MKGKSCGRRTSSRRRSVSKEATKMKGTLARHLQNQLGQVSFFPFHQQSSSSAVPRFQNLLEAEARDSNLPSSSPLAQDHMVDNNVDDKGFILSQDFFCTPESDYITPDNQYIFNGLDCNKENIPCPKSPEKLNTTKSNRTLSIHPTGNKKKDGQDHISAYLNLMVSSSSSFSVGWEVNTIVNLFVYDFLRDEYFSYQDASTRHFHKLQTEWGISKFVDLVSFNDHSNGFLIEDACVFGAEIFVIKPPSKQEYLSMVHEPPLLSYRWKFDNFSNVNLEKYESGLFPAGNYRWKLVFYPNGTIEGKGNSVSLFLTIDTSSIPSNTKLYVHCILRVKDQIKGQHAEIKSIYRHFSNSNPTWGSRTLVPLATLKDPTKGFLEANSCILETEFKVLGLVKPL